MTNRLLAIDAATEALSLCLFSDGEPLAHLFNIVGRGHAERLIPAIAALPDGGRANAIAVNIGPGSFTGVRIGLAAARAYGLAWNVPVTGYDALANVAVAAAAHPLAIDSHVTIVMLGGHGELFVQRFDRTTLLPTDPMRSVPITALASELNDAVLFGTGAETIIGIRGAGTAIPLHPDAGRLLSMPLSLRSLPAAASYGRGADARPMTSAVAD